MKTQIASQRGIGLIEVMIALTIGLVLLIGVAQYFVSMRQTATSAQQMSAVQNQQRMAMYFMHVAVAGAGFNPDPFTTDAVTQFPSSATFPTAGQALIGSGTNAGTYPAAVLSVRFTASTVTGGAEQGCSPNLIAGNVYTDEFSVANGYLVCKEINNTAGTAQTINNLIGDPVNKVLGMKVMYGVDAQNTFSAQQYLSAAEVTAGSFWGNVMTAEVTLFFTNPLKGQAGQPDSVSLKKMIPYMVNI